MMNKSDKAITHVTITYDDGSTMYVDGVEDCAAWLKMAISQASIAAMHGANKDPPINWKTTEPKKSSFVAHTQVEVPDAPICEKCGNPATLHEVRLPSWQCNECGGEVAPPIAPCAICGIPTDRRCDECGAFVCDEGERPFRCPTCGAGR